jgi:ribosomal protein S18 acetylase RimI-like enzyme
MALEQVAHNGMAESFVSFGTSGSAGVEGSDPPTSTREIRPCAKGDIARIAEIHRSQLLVPGTLLARLSPALIATFYETFLQRSIFLVHATNGQVDGFALGGSSRAVMACRLSFVRRHILFCIADLAVRPQLWPRAFRSVGKLIANGFSLLVDAPPCEDFRLLAIAVDRSARRQGVGTRLVRAFEEAICRDCKAYSLNVLKTNKAAIRFYENLAFQCAGENAIAWKFRKNLAPQPGPFEIAHS